MKVENKNENLEEMNEENKQPELENNSKDEQKEENKQGWIAKIDQMFDYLFNKKDQNQNEKDQEIHENKKEEMNEENKQPEQQQAEQVKLHDLQNLKEAAKVLQPEDENMQSLLAVLADYEQQNNNESYEKPEDLIQAIKEKYAAINDLVTKKPIELELQGETDDQVIKNDLKNENPLEWLINARAKN